VCPAACSLLSPCILFPTVWFEIVACESPSVLVTNHRCTVTYISASNLMPHNGIVGLYYECVVCVVFDVTCVSNTYTTYFVKLDMEKLSVNLSSEGLITCLPLV
jgi:hypothetical protein